MDTSQFLAQFGTIAAAPNGVQRLREMILQLAVMGKLVPQDPADEPASVLLQRIAAEKDRLIREGKIKRPKPLPAIRDDEKPFALPHGWEWVRLAEIGHDWGQKAPQKEFTYIDVSAIDNKKGVINSPSIVNVCDAPSRARKIVKKGTVIYSTVRPYLLNISIVEENYQPEPIASTAFAILHPYIGISDTYLKTYLRSFVFINYVESMQTGIAYPAINDKQFFSGIIPIPPFAEQKRIVAKVDSLMALCDKLETLQQQRQQLDPMTQTAVLEALLTPNTGGKDAWQRLNQHMTTLFHTPESVKALRETILQLAVMGKLVPQNPNDEPASVLLQHIATEKDRLIQEGKIKRQKSLSAIENSETLPELPKRWEIVNFGTYAQEVSTGPFGSMIHKSDYIQNGVPLINPSHMIEEKIIPDFSISVSLEKAEELTSYKIYKDDLVISRRGEMGRCALVDERSSGWLCGTGSFFIRFASIVDRQFILLLFKSKTIRDYLGGNSVGTTMTNLNHGILNNMPVLIPPLAEQQRIVAKVDSLMALCDRLEARLQAAQDTAGLFAAEASDINTECP